MPISPLHLKTALMLACLCLLSGNTAHCEDSSIARTAKAKPVMLTGRLEEIGGRMATLPVGLTIKGLKAQTPKMDPIAGGLMAGKTATFPKEWVGQWGGRLTVTWTYNADPSGGISKGSNGVTVFSFMPNSGRVTLQPTNIFFPVHYMSIAEVDLTADQIERLQARSGGRIDPHMQVRAVPIVKLRDSVHFDISGAKTDVVVLRNNLDTLRPECLEQDIIISKKRTDAYGRVSTHLTETCVRLSRVKERPDVLWAQVAHVVYDADGKSDMQTTMQGWLSTNWRSFATEIEKLEQRSVAQLGYTELCAGMGQTPLPNK